MTSDQRIDKLEERVNRIDDSIWTELKSINEKLTLLQVSEAKNHCPVPGKCLTLDTALGSAVLRIERLELALIDIDRWRNRMMGGLALVVLIATLFGPSIRKLLRLE